LNNLDANNPTTNTGTGTGTGTGSSNGTGTGTGSGSAVGTGSSHASTTSTGTSTGNSSSVGTGSSTGSGSGAGSTGSSGASHGGTNSGSPQPHTNTGSSTSNGSGNSTGATSTGSSSSHASTGSGTGTGSGSAVGTGSGHASTGHGSGAGSGASHAGTNSGSSAGSSGAGHSGANQQPHANTGSGPRPDPLIEKPRPHHTPENNPTNGNGSGDTESPAGGKNPEHPHPKDLSTPTTRNNNGNTPHTHHNQETTGPSSRGNPHVHGGDSTPTDNHNPPHPPTKPNPEHHSTDPDHPTNPEHPQRQGQESSSGDVKHPPSSDDHREGPDQPASGGNQQPRKVPGALYDEDGRPLHDKDGKPLEVDHGDGKRHYASDPADTYRDSQNALQNKEGGYSKDPYTGWDKDVDAFNDREPSTNHPWDDPTHDDNYHTDRQKRTDLDTIAHEKAETAKTTFNDLKSYGINPEGKSFNKLKNDLSKLLPYIDLERIDRANEIFDILDEAAASSEKAGRASEWLGERAASHRNKDLGRASIIGNPPDNPRDFTRTGPGKVDAAAIEGDTTFVVDEAKSGNSPNYPSRRTENGVRAQQGTLEYITDLLTGKNQDLRILENLTRLKQEGKHPKFFENLAAGKVELNYELIQARTNGNVTASNFKIAPPGGKIMLTWDGKGDLKITIVPKGK